MPAPRFSPGALPPHIVEAMSEADRKELGVKTRAEVSKKLEEKAERDIQNTVESYLRQLGYWPRTPEYLNGDKPESGWYFHLYNAKKNPMLLDVIVLSSTGAGEYIEFELKAKGGQLRPQQAALVTQGARVFYTAKDAMEYIKQWHAQVLKRSRNGEVG